MAEMVETEVDTEEVEITLDEGEVLVTDLDSLEPQEEVTEAQAAEETEEGAEEVPDKYKGKTLAEVVAMHQEAESLIGRHSSEVGELRGIVDDFIQHGGHAAPQAPASPETPAAVEVEDDLSFFEDPEAAVSKAIDNHPSVIEAREASQKIRQQQASAAVNEAHPDADKIIADPDFAKFVKESPIRSELFVRADTQYDFAAADELLTAYKLRKQTEAKALSESKAASKEALQAGATGSSKASSASRGKRIYKRSDILTLMRDNPAKYEAMAEEIQLAYLEKRVR